MIDVEFLNEFKRQAKQKLKNFSLKFRLLRKWLKVSRCCNHLRVPFLKNINLVALRLSLFLQNDIFNKHFLYSIQLNELIIISQTLTGFVFRKRKLTIMYYRISKHHTLQFQNIYHCIDRESNPGRQRGILPLNHRCLRKQACTLSIVQFFSLPKNEIGHWKKAECVSETRRYEEKEFRIVMEDGI